MQQKVWSKQRVCKGGSRHEMNTQILLNSMGGTYLGELANNIVELGKRVEEQRYPSISIVNR